jgi:hypothetical protein
MRGQMLATQLAAAISLARTTPVLDALSKAIWSGLANGHLTEDEAQSAATAVEGRRGEIRRPQLKQPATALPSPSSSPSAFRPRGQTLFARARAQRPPDRAATITRRRRLAASGPLPPRLAAQFTTGELAVLRVVADEVREKGRCDRTYAEMAARAGVGRTTAQNALRQAARLGLVTIEERPRPGRKHLPNIVLIVSKEWQMWMRRRPRASARAAPGTTSTGHRAPAAHLASNYRVQKTEHHGHRDSTRGFSR